MIYHRDTEFVQTFYCVTEDLKYFFQTSHEVLILTTSGTGGMEATITNIFSPGEPVLIVENGKFSERWTQMAEKFGLDVKRMTIQWGESISIEKITDFIKSNPYLKAVFLTHCETSTGAFTDLETIVPAIRELSTALIIIDAISSAGVLPLKMDQWGIDVTITGSQKGLGLPPGLAIIALNNRVWRHVEQAELPRYYFDFTRARQSLRLGRGSAFTPAIPLILAANVVLNDIHQQGIEKIWLERKSIATHFREKIIGLGFSIFPEIPADSLTVIKIDAPPDADHIISSLKEKYRIIVSRGQGQLSNKVIRVGHFVNVELKQLNQFLDALNEIKIGG